MSKLPTATGKQVIKALAQAGFAVSRSHGSHHFLRHADGRTTTVPVHGKEALGPGLLGKILRDTELSREELQKLL
jgi:predicted RNA binding protein YcfA (HicA-like mRNA interferase family)